MRPQQAGTRQSNSYSKRKGLKPQRVQFRVHNKQTGKRIFATHPTSEDKAADQAQSLLSFIGDPSKYNVTAHTIDADAPPEAILDCPGCDGTIDAYSETPLDEILGDEPAAVA